MRIKIPVTIKHNELIIPKRYDSLKIPKELVFSGKKYKVRLGDD